MKKLYFIALSFFAVCQLNAQTSYTLTQANSEPTVGDSYWAVALDTNNTPLPMNTSGQNVLWQVMDLTPQTGTATINTYSTAASNTNSANYPGTNLVQTDSSVYTYYKTTTNQLELLGVDAGFFDLNYNTNSAIVATYPISYGYTHSDAVGGTMNVPSASLNGPFSGTVITTADGTGTLNINNSASVFTNCIRIKTTQHLSFNLLFGAITGTIDQDLYNFYHSSSKFPVLTVSYSHVVASGLQSIDQMQTQVSTLSTVVIGVKENKLNDIAFTAYPNPAKNNVNLHFVTVKNEDYNIEISNTLGQIVKTISLTDLQPGVYNETIDLTGLSQGIYTIKVSGKYAQGTEKLIIE